MTSRIALVTGANRGIGLTIADALETEGFRVLRASRDGARGPKLDVTSAADVARVVQETDALDVLVDNAGASLDGFDQSVARKTLDVNFYGAMHVTDALLPRMRAGGRIVMVSSGMGSIAAVSADLRARLLSPSLSREELVAIVESFVEGVGDSKRDHAARGFPSSAYRVSKIALNALTRILARELADDPRRILVNAYDPGWVRSRMGGSGAPRSLAQGAKSGVFLATLPEGSASGALFRDERLVEW
jgi:NAD(P)-dependent dehydrogenase (short-subunit alcohol dehydrogenase family)